MNQKFDCFILLILQGKPQYGDLFLKPIIQLITFVSSPNSIWGHVFYLLIQYQSINKKIPYLLSQIKINQFRSQSTLTFNIIEITYSILGIDLSLNNNKQHLFQCIINQIYLLNYYMSQGAHLHTPSISDSQKMSFHPQESLPRKRTNHIIANFYKKQLEITSLVKPSKPIVQQQPLLSRKQQKVEDDDPGKKTIEQNANRIPDILKQLMSKQKKKINRLPDVQTPSKYKFQATTNIFEAEASKLNKVHNFQQNKSIKENSSQYKINYNIKSKSNVDTEEHEPLDFKLKNRQSSKEASQQKIHNTSLNSYESSQSISRSIKFEEWESTKNIAKTNIQNLLDNITQNKVIASNLSKQNLFEVNQNIIKSYLTKKGDLSIAASIQQVYDYFNQLCIQINIIFENPLIKKYKNCIFFGENSTHLDRLCQGFLYHYHNKIYFGEFKRGKRHGNGCQVSLKQDIVTRGRYEEGYKRGNFTVYKKNNYQYLGEMNAGIFQGYGILTTKESKYQGEFHKGMKHGKGKQHFFLSNQIYDGIYFQGKFQGRGQLTFQDYHYQGMFHEGFPQGQGKERTKNQQYNGQFLNGKREGNGELIQANGDRYIGRFKNGVMHGQGKLIFNNGKQLVGNFNNGKFVQEEATNLRRIINNNMYERRYKMLNLIKDNHDNINESKDKDISYMGIKGNQRYTRMNPEMQGDDRIYKKKIDDPLHDPLNPRKPKVYQTQVTSFSQSKNDQSQQLQNLPSKAKSGSVDFVSINSQNKKVINKPFKLDYSKFQSSLDDQIPNFAMIKKNLQHKLK